MPPFHCYAELWPVTWHENSIGRWQVRAIDGDWYGFEWRAHLHTAPTTVFTGRALLRCLAGRRARTALRRELQTIANAISEAKAALDAADTDTGR